MGVGRMIEVVCAGCKAHFQTHEAWVRRGRGKYCSRACKVNAQSRPVPITCAQCGIDFISEPSRRSQFCSHRCYAENKRRPTPISIQGDAAIIVAPNTGNHFVFDAEDVTLISGYAWHEDNKGYLKSRERLRVGKQRQVFAHLLIAGGGLVDEQVDHIDRNPKNNRRSNLRITSRSVNAQNRSVTRGTQSGYRGVYTSNGNKTFWASICKDRKVYRLGSFSTAVEAARVYDDKALELFGSNAATNAKLGLLR